MDGEPTFAWPTDGEFHRGYVDGLQGRAKRVRQCEEYEDGYACGCGDAAPDAADRHVRAAMALESLFGGDDLADIYITTAGGHRRSLEGLHAGDLARMRIDGVRGRLPFRSRIGLA